jgi:beta-glucosidase
MQRGAPIYQRVEDLLSKMTLTEKIVQTYAPYGAFDVEAFGSTSVGMMSINPATKCGACTPEMLVKARNAIQATLVNGSRLHIPGSFSQEALHSATKGGTVFPELVTQGSTWDTELVENISAAVAAEARMTGVDVAFSPVLNQWVDSRFGRLQEGYSENPTLTAAYAVAAANGFQGPQPAGKWAPMAKDKVVALGKHYAAYGAALGGLNGAPAELSERTLREFFLKSWKAFAKAGGKGAMTAHNTVLDRPCHAHPWLVNTVFRDEFSFGDGIIVSDCNDIEALIDFRVAKDMPAAAAAALEGGVDLDLQCGSSSAYTSLSEAIDQKLVNETAVEVSARRVLLEKMAAGLFDDPITDESLVKQLNNPSHQALALKAAEEGIVLLINKPPPTAARMHNGQDQAETMARPMLPLSAMTKRIAVIGPNGGCSDPEVLEALAAGKSTMDADACAAGMNMLGSYTQYQYNPTGAHPVSVPTAFDALKAAFPQANVKYEAGANIGDTNTSGIPKAVALAKSSDVAVVVVGDDLHTSSEWGDRDSLDLPGGQLQLLDAVVATGTPVVLVTVTGRTPTFGGPYNTILANVTAMLSAFRPGQAGGTAIANIISGVATPSGKLGQSWVRSSGQAMSGAAPFLQWRVGKWVANHRSPADPDGRVYDPYNTHAGAHPTNTVAGTVQNQREMLSFAGGQLLSKVQEVRYPAANQDIARYFVLLRSGRCVTQVRVLSCRGAGTGLRSRASFSLWRCASRVNRVPNKLAITCQTANAICNCISCDCGKCVLTATTPLWCVACCGQGLSYTTFEYADAKVMTMEPVRNAYKLALVARSKSCIHVD